MAFVTQLSQSSSSLCTTMEVVFWVSFLGSLMTSRAAVVAPPWADPLINPCAKLPRGWQMLYWPSDGKCYKIFKLGFPCPPTMELTPGDKGAECRCPPGTLRAPGASDCHPAFTRGPCDQRHLLVPANDTRSRLGRCTQPEECADPTQLLWPPDGRCYRRLSRGPCPPGRLLTMGPHGAANCTCGADTEDHVSEVDGRCYEHYSRGPCLPGQLFLPGGDCGCSADLPHYHGDTRACYEIDTLGPCNKGHRFTLVARESGRAECRCKPGNVLWEDGSCYRLYTRGPCGAGQLVAPRARCAPQPCRRSRLYFPSHKRCYRIGIQGPCGRDQVVLFDFEARPSVDGIAYNGVCGCAGALDVDNPRNCMVSKMASTVCKDTPGMVVMDGGCHMLYTKGPCGDGQWLVPRPDGVAPGDRAQCLCKPGYVKHTADSLKTAAPKDGCLPPAVSLARYLNNKYNKTLNQ